MEENKNKNGKRVEEILSSRFNEIFNTLTKKAKVDTPKIVPLPDVAIAEDLGEDIARRDVKSCLYCGISEDEKDLDGLGQLVYIGKDKLIHQLCAVEYVRTKKNDILQQIKRLGEEKNRIVSSSSFKHIKRYEVELKQLIYLYDESGDLKRKLNYLEQIFNEHSSVSTRYKYILNQIRDDMLKLERDALKDLKNIIKGTRLSKSDLVNLNIGLDRYYNIENSIAESIEIIKLLEEHIDVFPDNSSNDKNILKELRGLLQSIDIQKIHRDFETNKLSEEDGKIGKLIHIALTHLGYY